MRKRRKGLVVKLFLLLCLTLISLYSLQVARRYVLLGPDRQDQETSFAASNTTVTEVVTERHVAVVTPTPTVFLVSITVCPGLTAPQPTRRPAFQPVKGADAFVYAAHVEDDHVSVIALVRNRLKPHGHRLYCQVWHSDPQRNDPLAVVEAEVQLLREAHGRRYGAAFIKCPLVPEGRSSVVAVSVVSGHRCRIPGNKLPPLAVSPESKSSVKLQSEFTVCVTPLNLRYSRAYELVEMLEFNKILGADRFVFYNYSTGSNVDQVLQKYIKSGDVTVLPWNLPVRVDTWPPSKQPSDVWYFGQLAALNDCLLRNRHRARYIVFSDLDEFIVPLKDSNWTELISRVRKPPPARSPIHLIQRHARKNRDIFIFQCTFFRKEWPRPLPEFETVSSKLKSSVMGYTRRETEILPAGTRSKMIVNPRLVQEVGVHQVWQGESSLVVPPTEGLLYHYRSWQTPSQAVGLVTSEHIAVKFGGRLVENMQKVWASLPGVPLDIDMKTYRRTIS